jgi:hypothetical protein
MGRCESFKLLGRAGFFLILLIGGPLFLYSIPPLLLDPDPDPPDSLDLIVPFFDMTSFVQRDAYYALSYYTTNPAAFSCSTSIHDSDPILPTTIGTSSST